MKEKTAYNGQITTYWTVLIRRPEMYPKEIVPIVSQNFIVQEAPFITCIVYDTSQSRCCAWSYNNNNCRFHGRKIFSFRGSIKMRAWTHVRGYYIEKLLYLSNHVWTRLNACLQKCLHLLASISIDPCFECLHMNLSIFAIYTKL